MSFLLLLLHIGRLNWWTSTGRLPQLEPLATSGDGNCLLHAASLYMWGLHDHSLILRTALHRLLSSGLERQGIKSRWKHQTQLRNDEAGGLTFTEEEWEFEWDEILRIATNKPRRRPTTDSLRRHSSLRMASYESLEEVHIFALAHTLRRPIIVIADRTIKDMSGEDLAPIYFGGIYLPLEVNPTSCHKSPLVLAYDSSHFSPLVATQSSSGSSAATKSSGGGGGGGGGGKQQPHTKYARMSSRVETVIPLVTPDGALLPVQFVYDPKKKGVEERWSKMEYSSGEFPDDIVRLLESYMNVRWIRLDVVSPSPSSSSSSSTTAATSSSSSSSSSFPDARSSEDYDHIFPIKVPKMRFPAASVAQEAQPIYQKELVEKYLKHIRDKFRQEEEAKAQREAEREEQERKRQLNKSVPCEGEGCEMFGRPATNNLCSVCYQKLLASRSNAQDQATSAARSQSPAHSTPPPPPAPSSSSSSPSYDELDVVDPRLLESHDFMVGVVRSADADVHRPIPQQQQQQQQQRGVAATTSPSKGGKRPLVPLQPVAQNQQQKRSGVHSEAPPPPLQGVTTRSARSETPDENTPRKSGQGPVSTTTTTTTATAATTATSSSKNSGGHSGSGTSSSSSSSSGTPRRGVMEFRAAPVGHQITPKDRIAKDATSKSRSPTPPLVVSPQHRDRSQSPPVPPFKPQRSKSPPLLPPSPVKSSQQQQQPSSKSSPQHPGKPASSPVKSKGATPSPTKEGVRNLSKAVSPGKSKGDTPFPPKDMSQTAGAPTAAKKMSWTSSPLFKKPKGGGGGGGGGYSRDNILPLSHPNSGVASSGEGAVTMTSVRKTCKTVGCEFFGASDRAGYCSACYKALGDNATAI